MRSWRKHRPARPRRPMAEMPPRNASSLKHPGGGEATRPPPGASAMPNPMPGPNRFKLGVFSANADGGLTLTRVPERWPALWPEVVEVAQMADCAGIEFFLPIARWKGFG